MKILIIHRRNSCILVYVFILTKSDNSSWEYTSVSPFPHRKEEKERVANMHEPLILIWL